ncbi:MAG: HNH endonuclease [Bdellovibrionales bacterium]|nr:HNH endonuclease [Bdellovibrionales bacterium]
MRSKGIAAFLALMFFSTVSIAVPRYSPARPDPMATPGELCHRKDPDFIEYRYKERIPYCVRNVSSELKADIYDYYKVPQEKRRFYTIDHFIPLSIGGSNHAENLWPEHRKIKELRINLENEVYDDVKSGRMTQDEAVAKIIKAKMNPPLPYAQEYFRYRH